ncbi:MAG: nickel pincer cofactor biosynthesis protein LarB [Planctomycetota bacterium]
MDRRTLETLLAAVRSGESSVEQALDRLSHFPVQELGHTRLDTQRALRCGFPEVVFGERKTPEELVEITRALVARHGRVLVTRVSEAGQAALRAGVPGAEAHARARAVSVNAPPPGTGTGLVLVLSAGTADAPVAAEAELTARMLGARTEWLADVGVAGLHRLLAHTERLRQARALVVVAGMEGALPSVVGGLVARPVVAVPTSVGYGASLGGLAALLAMLNSCAAGVTVVNIDNGFGAGYAAALINRTDDNEKEEGRE